MNRDFISGGGSEIIIDRERLAFLLYTCFGSEQNPYLASSRRAYRDLCRTLRLDGGRNRNFRESIDELLAKEIGLLLEVHDLTQEEYDRWHQKTCEKAVSACREAGVELSIGQAQKWVNMTMKYLYVCGHEGVAVIYGLLHVPVDQYVLTAAETELAIPRPWVAWSRMDDYEAYLAYQKAIRKKVVGAPLRWEFRAWNDEAARRVAVG